MLVEQTTPSRRTLNRKSQRANLKSGKNLPGALKQKGITQTGVKQSLGVVA